MTDLRTAAQQALEALEQDNPAGRTATITALRAALAQQAKPQGCEHCNHPLYAATKCRVCGRVTEQAEPQSTHSSECWRWHHKCAVAKIERECKHD